MRKAPIWFLTLLGIIALVVAVRLWPRAFPSATIDFQITSAQATTRLASFLEAMGIPTPDYRTATTFGEDTETTRFIELERGIPALEKLTREGLNAWYWNVRWFKPQQHEEFGAALDPQGRIVGFSHTIEEEKAAPEIDQDAARRLAEEFLRKFITQHPPGKLRFISASNEKRPHRTDYYFTWERDDFRLGDAPYRLGVTVQGNQVGSYSESLKVPERWSRDFEKKRETNNLCESIATAALMGICIGYVVVLILAIRDRQLRWRSAIPWGWLALFAAITVLEQVNSIPHLLASYATTQNWNTFVAQEIFSTLREALFSGVGLWMLALVADALYREKMQGQLSFRRALGKEGLGDPQTIRSLFLGVVFAIVNVAYVSAFYVLGKRWGIWTPVEIEYAKTLTGWFPWVAPINTGLTAAFSEELLFRVVGLFVIWKVVRVRWIAVVLSSATWAFLHSNYPQMPGYARGLELTVVGILWSVLLLRYGLLTTLTAHYLYDCWLGDMVVFQSASWLDRIGALLGSAWPIAVLALGIWLCRKKGRNVLLPEPETVEPLPDSSPQTPLPVLAPVLPIDVSRSQQGTLLFAALAIIVACYSFPLPQRPIERLGTVALSRAEISAQADAIVKARGFDPASYRKTATCKVGSTHSTYLLENGSFGRLADLFNSELPDTYWTIRFYRVLEKEELRLKLDKNGKLLQWEHLISREAPGASLDEAAALKLAKKTLETEYGVDFSKEKLVSALPQKQEHRMDYWFDFERTDWHWGEAKLRTWIQLKGDEPMGFYRYVKVPEAWELKQKKSGWRKFLTSELQTWLSIGLGILVATGLILVIAKRMIPWRLAFQLAWFPALIGIALFVDSLPWFFSSYETTTPLANFLLTNGLKTAVGTVLGYLGQALLIGVYLGFARWAFGWDLRRLQLWPPSRAERSLLWRSILLSSLVAYAILLAEGTFSQALQGFFLPTHCGGFSIPSVNSSVPWLRALLAAGNSGFESCLRIVGFWSAVGLAYKRWPKLTLSGLLFVFPLLQAIQQDSLSGVLCNLLLGILGMALSGFIAFKVWRFNPAAIFLTHVLWSLSGEIIAFSARGGEGYRWQALPLALAVAVPLLIGWLIHRLQPDSQQSPPQQSPPPLPAFQSGEGPSEPQAFSHRNP